MKTPLDINLLIDKAQQLVHDGNIEFAYSGEMAVQILEAETGERYMLKVVMTLVDDVFEMSEMRSSENSNAS